MVYPQAQQHFDEATTTGCNPQTKDKGCERKMAIFLHSRWAEDTTVD